MTYRTKLYSNVADVDRDAWEAVQQYDPTPFLDLRFLQILNETLGETSQCWPLLITDEADRPVAIACLSLFQVDGSIFAGPIIRAVTAGMRKIRPPFLQLPVLILGLPVSTGHSPLVLHPDADVEAVREALLRVLVELERRERPSLTLAKEFDDHQTSDLRDLVRAGFLEVNNMSMYEFPAKFADFDEFCRHLNNKRRYNIRKSQQKLQRSGVLVKHLRGGDGALDYLTEDVHRLYVAVYEKSATKFEFLPLEFFREVARLFPDESWFTFLIHNDRVVAFSFRLAYRQCVHMMYLGFDYELNRQFDLYFNLLYENLAGALEQQPRMIYFGENGGDVKLRLGCRADRRTLFIRGHRLWHPLLKGLSPFLFPKDTLPPPSPDDPDTLSLSNAPGSSSPAPESKPRQLSSGGGA